MNFISAIESSALAAGSVESFLTALHAEFCLDHDGELATYIPELAKANPNHFGIVIATTDGRIHAVGDCDALFTIQSVSKAFMYGDVLKRLGREKVLSKVGVEPTGDAFNSIVLDEVANRPFNPMVNAGAIVVSNLIEGGDRAEREKEMLATLGAFAGREMVFDWDVFRSELTTGHRNRAIAYLMLNAGMLDLSPDDALDIYYKQCSALVTCRDLAIMGATLANDGVNPLTRERVLPSECVQDVLSVMYGCGMYDYAGQWSFDVGLPAKSGVAGGLVAVAPGQFAIGFYSPRLDRFGNTVRGVKACKKISGMLSLHSFFSGGKAGSIIRRELSGRNVRSSRVRPREVRALLDADPAPVRIAELQGSLHFANVERVASYLDALAGETSRAILDLRHVYSCDAASAAFLGGLQRIWTSSGRILVWSCVPATGALEVLNTALAEAKALVFPDIDHALEYFEDLALPQSKDRSKSAIESMKEIDLCRGLDEQEWTNFVACLAPSVVEFEPGSVIARTGDAADCLFVILAGSVLVSSPPASDQPSFRLASLDSGLTFGEMGLFEGARRSADVIAEQRTICVVIAKDAVTRLEALHPVIAAKIYANLIREQAARLQRANVTIHSLR
ncbi:glutaminase A [Methylocapsa palsarum]|uniref:Glutaminase n=1 Tax=Methylocapsa palsarum TaxID=1612308 RepID=A0A1I4A1N1_9HYPH|nr:glutaminase A [Methylocapsa palsarum]SFK50017.1 L-glutaminase [Methylocapsa palsarum]